MFFFSRICCNSLQYKLFKKCLAICDFSLTLLLTCHTIIQGTSGKNWQVSFSEGYLNQFLMIIIRAASNSVC